MIINQLILYADARYLRWKGIPAIGVSPIMETPILLHDHDEFIWTENFYSGIQFYKAVIEALAKA